MLNNNVHRRLNILTGEWVLVSSERTKRPWQGQVEKVPPEIRPEYDPNCYLCPGNVRANGEYNPQYKSTYAFNNDFSALRLDTPESTLNDSDLLIARSEKGLCRVVCFSPKHNLTLAEMEIEDIKEVIRKWKVEYESLGSNPSINYVQIFENRGQIMGASNPHPHCQIWAEESLPVEPAKEQTRQLEYFRKKQKDLLLDYLSLEVGKKERIVYENELFVLLVPFWAVWPFETMIIPKRKIKSILEFSEDDIELFAEALKYCTVKYDNIFNVSFPYSSGIHQAPTDGKDHPEWQLHMHFYPPLLRSASIKKFMVGYEMLANPQRDILPEKSAEILRSLPTEHYSRK
ncbi:MAG: UDP-glucose--hexose-1-phosphate uridylyltransferase [Bacteroidota bacterium]|jgi:UDPglucose--hexose-1-phosphate uridylyltransferase|nr:UDP-glucose--hexose-1-phosphate uridylyltransferase [Ignavibacteria bacterium]MCU7497856.1 UDP-glucose--hexose-1-phosphate uridylyltransferase [Ignavibacteria bacterium]MCU7511137.1 UDP-glucose--hexose-1-phosphate uridylyltransferase [Ignavibacteria bacterium]MCU7518684.1 UDP-glucose--hexose-1-phosphate uridylyltransferase [Ignavibacteria bacterium]MCU7522913.1 UDP-glucose--hexose-1-phosphate uridylyltransferase [Ignavibacteria bacterium]